MKFPSTILAAFASFGMAGIATADEEVPNRNLVYRKRIRPPRQPRPNPEGESDPRNVFTVSNPIISIDGTVVSEKGDGPEITPKIVGGTEVSFPQKYPVSLNLNT